MEESEQSTLVRRIEQSGVCRRVLQSAAAAYGWSKNDLPGTLRLAANDDSYLTTIFTLWANGKDQAQHSGSSVLRRSAVPAQLLFHSSATSTTGIA